MLVAELLPFAKSLCGRKWTDEDIIEDVQFLRDELKARFDSLTYVALRCGTEARQSDSRAYLGPGRSIRRNCNLAIRIGHPYTSRNLSGKKMRANYVIKTLSTSGALFCICSDVPLTGWPHALRLLVKLLNESSDPTILAVSAHDLGQFVKYCDRGKKCVLVHWLCFH